MAFEELTRRQIRYWLFSFKYEEMEEASYADDAPEGLKETFEDMEWFQSWKDFGKTWDVDKEDAFRIIPLRKSHDEEWNEILEKSAKPLPLQDSGDDETAST